MKFKFEKLNVWQRSMDLGEEIYTAIKVFPEYEKFNLSSQILRASDSVALNISEGTIGTTDPDFRRFIGYSIRSLAEVVTCLHKARRRDYLNNDVFEKLYDDCFNLMNMLVAFQRNTN
ncbi:MAG: four helix bundle protein [Crocinitomicaceae bacterium]|nr:four helix bundle protein [Crocinitomicaceae bacterium]